MMNDTMKKICFITQCTLPIPTVKGGAVETLVEYILDENEKKPKYEFTVISAWDNESQKLASKYKYTNFEYIRSRSKKANALLNKAQRYLQHIGLYIPFSMEFVEIINRIKKMPKQDLYIYEAGPTTQIPLLGRVIPKDKLWVHIHWDGMGNKKKDKYFSKLIPVSNYIGNQWRKATGCSSSKIHPLYNCAKIERFMKQSSESERLQLRKELQIPKKNKVLIYAGRIVPEKGVKELIEAFNKLNDNDVTLLIIGSANFGSVTNTPYEKEVESIIKNSTKPIIFTGFVHQTKLYQYYNIADVAVMPSMFEDPAPLVCIETQATGTPLIATRVGGIAEYADSDGVILVERNETLVTNLANEMHRLLNSSDLRDKMGKSNRQNALRYSTEGYFRQFCEIVDDRRN